MYTCIHIHIKALCGPPVSPYVRSIVQKLSKSNPKVEHFLINVYNVCVLTYIHTYDTLANIHTAFGQRAMYAYVHIKNSKSMPFHSSNS